MLQKEAVLKAYPKVPRERPSNIRANDRKQAAADDGWVRLV
jgi:hypothetical protein